MQNELKTYFYKYKNYINSLMINDNDFLFTSNSLNSNPFSLCFAIFGYHLIGSNILISNRDLWDRKVRENFNHYYKLNHSNNIPDYKNKNILQLLTFSLSALAILGTLTENPFQHKLINNLIKFDTKEYLTQNDCLIGLPSSGNMAMFLGIIYIYCNDYLDFNVKPKLDNWVELHSENINKFGFWTKDNNFSYKHFQNGYHQYEILNYLNIDLGYQNIINDNLERIVDDYYHYAPYPGGGSCYDYDAIFFLTNNFSSKNQHHKLLNGITKSVFKIQNLDGGFPESKFNNDIPILNFFNSIRHLSLNKKIGLYERCLVSISKLKFKNKRMKSHFDKYQKKWNESSLWDSWFRMLLLARIDKFNNYNSFNSNFINFPGIGFYN